MTARDRIRLAFATALLAVGCGGECVDPLAGGPFEGVDFDHAITNVRELVSTAGIRRATVLGETAYVYEESESTEIVGVRVTMYDERGAQTGSLTADRGELGEDSTVHGTGLRSDANFQRIRVREPTGRVEGLDPAN